VTKGMMVLRNIRKAYWCIDLEVIDNTTSGITEYPLKILNMKLGIRFVK
jgi:hypothetical protein